MRASLHITAAVFLLAGASTGNAADLVVPPSQVVVVARDVPVLVPPRRYLTTYMAKYPFGVLREDYTPLGAPGVSKRDYYGVPRLTATLHVTPRHRWVRKITRRTVVSVRY